MQILWTARSSNRKTGSVLTAWVGPDRAAARESCAGCPLLAGGCYAHAGTVGTGLSSLARAALARPERYTLGAALARRVKTARMVRLTALGDIGRCGVDVARGIVATVRAAGPDVVGYTHHWREPEVSAAWRGTLLASCESLSDVDAALDAGWRASVVVPQSVPRSFLTPRGRRVVVCPATIDRGQSVNVKKVTCNDCRLCAGSKPGPVIAFPIHGSQRRKAPRVIAGKEVS